jgi:chromosome segregation ATPase
MTAPSAAQRTSASVETEIRSLTMKRASIESQQQRFANRLLQIDAEIEPLKPRHFDGDAKAAAAIEQLEIEKRDLLLRVEGALTHIRKFDAEIISLRREFQSLRQLDVAEEARRRRERFERRHEELVDARIATFKPACRALYDEADFIDSEINRQPLDESEKTWRLQAVERGRKKLEAVANEIVNNGWKSGPHFGTGHLTTLVAKLPPENKNGLR